MTEQAHKKAKGFWQVADPKIWIASTVPLVLGVLIAYIYTGIFHLFWMILSFIGIYLIEIGKNAINECVDYISGADRFVDKEHRTPFSGGKKTIVDGLLTVRQSAVIAIVTMASAALIGLLIVLFREPKVLWIGLIGFVVAVIYSLPPFKLCYRGLGEVAVGIVFGPLILNGMYVVMSGRFDLLPALISIPIGFLIANVLWINQFPDYEADLAGGKKNGVARLGKQKAVKVYGLLFALAYLSVIPIVIYTGHLVWFLTWSTIPMAYRAVKNSFLNRDNISKLTYSNATTIKIYLLTGLNFCLSMFIIIILQKW